MKKIAVMLPDIYRGGSLRAAKNVAKSIALQAQRHGEDIQVVFSYVKEGKYNLHVDFDDLQEFGVILRETKWQISSKESLLAAIELININKKFLDFPFYCFPTDGANDFYDCDLWLIISDRLPAPLLPLRRYAFIVYDYIQRYVPEIFGDNDNVWNSQVANLISSVRHASKVFTTTPSTQKDLISYAGVNKELIHLLEMDFHPIETGSVNFDLDLPENYILWTTNTAYHKNHLTAIDAYEMYVQELGGTLDLVITGNWTEYFDPANEFASDDPVVNSLQVQYLRKKLKRSLGLSSRIHVMGNVSDKMYAQILKNSHFLWHPVLYDNGTFAVMEAAYLGTPSLSARYPAMEYINQKFELHLFFFDPRNPKEMAETLLHMENSAKSISVPDQTALLAHEWKKHSLNLYKEIEKLLW
jgi:glycosyltransferase involved in cell wall biosynthesis